MKIGIYFDLRNPGQGRSWPAVYTEALEVIEEAERLGAASVWLTEHHLFDDGYLPQPLVFAAAIAARTTRLRIGTAVLLAPLKRVAELAEEAALVDILSGGRLELGLGAGYRRSEFAALGADFSARVRSLDDSVIGLRKLWAEGKVTPPPVQDPVPLWLGYHQPAGARRAGRLGAGLLSLRPHLLGPYLEGINDGGHQPETAKVSGVVNMMLSDDPERTSVMAAPHVAYRVDSYARHGADPDGPIPPAVDPVIYHRSPRDQLRFPVPGPRGEPPPFVFATPAEAAALLLDSLGAAPVDHVFFWADAPGLDPEIARRHVELLCTELGPLVSGAAPRPD